MTSKPMTEARLAEIEADTKNYGICCMDCSVETILELTAEVRRLRECIKNAPTPQPVYGTGLRLFKKWKREALGDSQ